MNTCPNCGAQNDPSNHFCDQCGFRLEATSAAAPVATPAATPAAAPAAAPADASAGATLTCSFCGAAVVPGEAFCDTCGAPLPPAPVSADAPVAPDAPTVIALPTNGADTTQQPTDDIPTIAAPSVPAEPAESPAEAPVATPIENEPVTPVAPAAEEAAPVAPVAEEAAPVAPAAEEAAPVAPVAPAEEPEAAAVAPAVPATPAVDVAAERARLEEEIATQDKLIAQMEQMQATFGAATPQAILDGLQQARDTKAKAEAELQALPTVPSVDPAEIARLEEEIATQDKLIAQMEQMQATFGAATPQAILDGLQQARDTKAKAEAELQALPTVPSVDPAEIARLEEEIATQDKLIAQMEQMQATFGAATPQAILDGLQQARDTKAKAEAELQALTGGAAPAAAPAATPAAAPAATPAAAPAPEAAPAAAQVPVAPPVPAPDAIPPFVPSSRPRLVLVDGGQELPLPEGKTEFIVGREDPISAIFPEIDLTSFGGEAGGVSRQHARIVNQNGQWSVIDLDSTNYTRVDGVKIDPQVPVAIKDGSRLQFGRVVVEFHI